MSRGVISKAITMYIGIITLVVIFRLVSSQNVCDFSDNFLPLYKYHFILTKTITIRILSNNKYGGELGISNDFINLLTYFDYNFAVKVEFFYLDEVSIEKNVTEEEFNNSSNTTSLRNIAPIEMGEFIKLKRISSDCCDGYIIIVWNLEIFKQFLNGYPKIIDKPRTPHIFIILSPPFPNPEKQIYNFLTEMWSNHFMLNSLIQLPCSRFKKLVYFYDPFIKTGTTWGHLRIYPVEEVLTKPRILTYPLKNLHGYPLKIGIFPRDPNVITTFPKLLQGSLVYKNITGTFGGPDGINLQVLSSKLNFTVIRTGFTGESDFGEVFPNGTATKSLNDLVHRKIIFHANLRFVRDNNSPELEYTVTTVGEDINIVAPKSEIIPRWAAIFKCFSKMTWALMVLISFIGALFWSFLNDFQDRISATGFFFAFLVGIPVTYRPRWHQFYFLGTCLGFSMVVIGVVQGYMFTSFTTVNYYPDLNTLQEVVDSNYPIAAPIFFLITRDTPIEKKMKDKSIPASYVNRLDPPAYYRNVVSAETRPFLNLMIKTKYRDKNGLPLLHIVPEKIISFLLAYLVPRGCPFLHVFNDVITKITEGGLYDKWYRDTVEGIFYEHRDKERSSTGITVFSVYDLQVAFICIGLGQTISLIIFLCELSVKRRNVLFSCEIKITSP